MAASRGNRVRLDYELRGPMEQIRVPPRVQSGPADGLWQHTCFEAFVGNPMGENYEEFNFSPSGQWARYRFARERQRSDGNVHKAAPDCGTEVSADRLRVSALLPVQDDATHAQPALCGLTAVIEMNDGTLSYWALHHPAPRPDFHHRGGWTLALPWRFD